MDIYKQDIKAIFISVKYLGLWFEFWVDNRILGDSNEEFVRETRLKYQKKFKTREFKMRLYYPNKKYVVTRHLEK